MVRTRNKVDQLIDISYMFRNLLLHRIGDTLISRRCPSLRRRRRCARGASPGVF